MLYLWSKGERHMSLRGKAAIVGYGEIPTRRVYPGRSAEGLAAEAFRLALENSGLRREDIDGIVTEGMAPGVGRAGYDPGVLAQYMGIVPTWGTGVSTGGASGATALTIASMAVDAGLANYILVVFTSARDPSAPAPTGVPAPNYGSEFENPYGLAAGANTNFALMYQRHIYEYGTKTEQLAHHIVNQRFNALENPNSAFQGQPITIDDVLNSRVVNSPLHLLECVMPCAGANALIVTTSDRAKALKNRPVYVLGAGYNTQPMGSAQGGDSLTETAVKISAPRAFRMAGYNPHDMQFAQFYD